jgi:hypothetical protein
MRENLWSGRAVDIEIVSVGGIVICPAEAKQAAGNLAHTIFIAF